MRILHLLLACLLILAPGVNSQADVSICELMDAHSYGELAIWNDAAQTWANLPDGLEFQDFLYVTSPLLPDAQVQGYEVWISWSSQEMWVFPFQSLRHDDSGHHDLCTVRRYIRKTR